MLPCRELHTAGYAGGRAQRQLAVHDSFEHKARAAQAGVEGEQQRGGAWKNTGRMPAPTVRHSLLSCGLPAPVHGRWSAGSLPMFSSTYTLDASGVKQTRRAFVGTVPERSVWVSISYGFVPSAIDRLSYGVGAVLGI
jgi:hypothetical protein